MQETSLTIVPLQE